jgi:site-specific DNA recombinase
LPVVDAEGERLTPSHAAKGGKRYRYYISRSLITDPGRTSETSWRLPAVELERLVVKQIREFLCDQNRIWALSKEAGLSHQEAVSALKRASKLSKALLRGADGGLRSLLLHLVKKIVVQADRIVLFRRL